MSVSMKDGAILKVEGSTSKRILSSLKAYNKWTMITNIVASSPLRISTSNDTIFIMGGRGIFMKYYYNLVSNISNLLNNFYNYLINFY
jgi:hypothetical protein